MVMGRAEGGRRKDMKDEGGRWKETLIATDADRWAQIRRGERERGRRERLKAEGGRLKARQWGDAAKNAIDIFSNPEI
jgi:hypothetical protein